MIVSCDKLHATCISRIQSTTSRRTIAPDLLLLCPETAGTIDCRSKQGNGLIQTQWRRSQMQWHRKLITQTIDNFSWRHVNDPFWKVWPWLLVHFQTTMKVLFQRMSRQVRGFFQCILLFFLGQSKCCLDSHAANIRHENHPKFPKTEDSLCSWIRQHNYFLLPSELFIVATCCSSCRLIFSSHIVQYSRD